MADMLAIGAASQSLNVLRTIATGLVELRDFNKLAGLQADMNKQILQLYGTLHDLQNALFAAEQAKRELETKIAELERKVSDRNRYELYEPREGSFVYRLRQGVDPPEPTHYVCQTCYDKGVKAVLEDQTAKYSGRTLYCPACERRITIEKPQRLPPATRGGGGPGSNWG